MRALATIDVGTLRGGLKAFRTFVAASLIASLPLVLQAGGANAAAMAIRIDAGSAVAYTDSTGRVWQADRSFVGGATTANAIRTGPTGTADPALFKTMRYGKDFSYAIPVATAGTYLLRLHTAELNFSTPGSRQFTISAEGKPVTADLDLAKAPGIRAPWTLEVPVTVTDGTLNLRFLAALDYAQVSGIEILGTGAAPATSATTSQYDEVTRIDAGSTAAYTDSAGRTWQADRSFVGGATTANAIRTGPTGTADPALFKTMRYGKDFSYAIPVSTAGTYLLRLHTVELNFSTAGLRRFTISAEGKPVAADLDLAKAPGIRAPWTLEVPVTVTDGTLNLRFLAALDYAQISGIEIVRKVDPYQLVWADEFDGTAVDTTKWNVRNNWAAANEEAMDTNRPANVFVSNGVLTIRSLREQRTVGSTTRQFTSGYLDTIGKQSWTYGRFSMRAQLATQQGTSKGIWPAFWMRPDDGGVGEIDIMEAIGSDATGTEWNKTHQTIHHDYTVTVPAQAHSTTLPTGTSPSDGFHTYSVEWSPGSMIWSIDGTEVWRRDRTTTSWLDEAFARPFNIRLNQQVGGTWAGTPTAATTFPADYKVDWVRVYQKP